jgi:electron transfer flavoprotein beta subunit
MSVPITVLVSVRIDPTSGRATRSRADAAAVALAQKALVGDGREPRLYTVGAMPESVARDYLAQGVSEIIRLLHAEESLAGTVSALVDACRAPGIVLTGPRGESGLASGMLPYLLAQRLQRPLINEVIDLQPEADGGWRVVQALPRGARHAWRLEPGVAAVLVASPRLAQREDLPQRHAWVAAQEGHISSLPVSRRSPTQAETSGWVLEPPRKLRRPLAAASNESGAARMARATGSAAPAKQGGTVIREGSAMDKAQLLLEHLRKLSLVSPT